MINAVARKTQGSWHGSAQALKGDEAVLLTTIIRVSFRLPDEYEAIENFKRNNDMDEWKVYGDTIYTTFVKTTNSTYTEVK